MTRAPYPWQISGRDFLLNGGSCLAFDPGLGKTLAALLADAARDPSPHPLLVACPVVAIGVWQHEIDLVHPGARVHVIKDGREIPPGTDVALVSIDLPARTLAVAKLITGTLWRRLIVDEAHKLKAITAARTKFWLTDEDAVAGGVAETWLLTGTPAPNGLCTEVWPLVYGTQPNRLADFTAKARGKPSVAASFEKFARHFMRYKRITAAGAIRDVIDGNQLYRVPEFNNRMQGWSMRLKKDDDKLPPKLRRIVPLQVTDLEAYDEFMDTPEGRALAAAIGSGDIDILRARNTMATELATLRRVLARSKVQATADWVSEAVSAGEPKVVVFGWHVEALAALVDLLKETGFHPVVVTGHSSAAERTAAVKTFQTDPHCTVFVGNIAAAGVAVTLTAARRVVFMEASWVPGDNVQAEDRCHRMGQTGTVAIDYLVTQNTVDEAVMERIERKMQDIDAIGA